MGIVFFLSVTDAKPVLLKRQRCLNGAYLKKRRSRKRRLTMTTLKTSSSIFPVKAVHKEL